MIYIFRLIFPFANHATIAVIIAQEEALKIARPVFKVLPIIEHKVFHQVSVHVIHQDGMMTD